MRVCSLLSINTAMAIAKYMQIRKIQNAFGIFQKSVDSLLCGETKIGERIPQTITIAMVNLTRKNMVNGFAPIFPDTCYHLTHYWLAAVDIPVASDNPVHYADAIRYNARMPLQGSLLPLTRLVWA